nr:aquaporin AQPAe.a-like isoform X3 [Halyomorpha halys]
MIIYLEAHLFKKDAFSSVSEGVKAVVAEIIGTAFLVLFGCGTCLSWGTFAAPTQLQIAIGFGFIIASMVQTIGHVSGCNINPAVTVGLLASGRIGLLRTVLYIPAQCVGAIAGAALLYLVSPEQARSGLGTPSLGTGVTVMQGFLVEALISAVLILVVCAVTDPSRMDVGNAAPVAIGLAITTSHIFAIPFTSSSMNPARALGPAVMTGGWDNHWIYWIAPLVGAAIAGLVYRFVFSASKDDEHSYDL